MIVLIEEVSGDGDRDILEEAATAKGFTIATPKPKTVGFWVTASLDAIDLIMIAQGFHMTAAEMCDKAMDAVLTRLIMEMAAEGMMLLHSHRYLDDGEHKGNLILVFLFSTDLRSLS